jgi:hypothetical protein
MIKEGHLPWNHKFDLGAGGRAAPNAESCPDSISPLAHAQQAPMAITSGLECLSIDSTAIVAHQDNQAVRRILELQLNTPGLRMAERIHQRFAPDSVNLIPEQWAQLPGLALHDHPKPYLVDSFPMKNKFLRDCRKGIL